MMPTFRARHPPVLPIGNLRLRQEVITGAATITVALVPISQEAKVLIPLREAVAVGVSVLIAEVVAVREAAAAEAVAAVADGDFFEVKMWRGRVLPLL